MRHSSPLSPLQGIPGDRIRRHVARCTEISRSPDTVRHQLGGCCCDKSLVQMLEQTLIEKRKKLLPPRLAVCQRSAKGSQSGVGRIPTASTKEGETRKLKGCKIAPRVSLPQRETLCQTAARTPACHLTEPPDRREGWRGT